MLKNTSFLNLFIVISIIFYGSTGYSQTSEVKVTDSTMTKEPSKLKFGMGFGLNFVGATSISISPNLMYHASDKVRFGGGLQGSYSSIKDVQSTTTIGANVISFFDLSKKITTLVEFAELNVSTKTETIEGDIKDSYWDSALFVGAGFNITKKITIGAKYNMLYKEDESVYTSAVIPFVNIAF